MREISRLPFWWIVKALAFGLKHLTVKKIVEYGRGNIPKEGPLMFLTNHFTTAEEAGALIYLHNRPFHILYKSELEKGFRGFWVALLFRLAGFIPTRREVKGEPIATSKVRKAINKGNWIMGMPERTSRHEGLIYAKGRGTARVAEELNCPIQPVGISGGKGAIVHGFLSYFRLGKKQTIKVFYGIPFYLDQLGICTENDPSGEKGTFAAMVRIGALLPENLRGFYEKDVEEFLAGQSFDIDFYRDAQKFLED